MAPHSSTAAWKIPWMEEPGRLQSMESIRVGHDWATSLSLSTFMHWRRKWQPTPVFLPGESHGWRSVVGCSPWGCRVGHDWSDLAAAADAYLELSCSFDDPTDVCNFISDSSAFFKSSLNIWKFAVHVLLKPGLENFEHYFTSVWDECNCVVVWAFFGIAFFGIEIKTDLFQSCGHCWVFQICWHMSAAL